MDPPVIMNALELARIDRYRMALGKDHTAGEDNTISGHGGAGRIDDNLYPHGLLEIGDVDSDAQDADDTWTGVLCLMAYGDFKVQEELEKYLHAKGKERLKLQSARIAGVNAWLQAIQT